jgi:hypothetical protein
MLEGLRKPTELIVIVVSLLAYGCPIQAIVHAFWLDERTVASWRDRAGQHCQLVHQAFVPQGQLDAQHVQVDEIRVKGRGMIVWMGLALMVSTRLWLGGVVSVHRDRRLADRLLQQVRACCRPRHPILVCTDGWAAYVRRVGVFEIPVGHGRGREQEPLGQELTRRGNSKVDCSMLLKRKTREDMYLAVLQVLCAW